MATPINKSDLAFRYETVQQVEAIYCLIKCLPFPIGFIWFARTLRNHTEIGYVFVHEHYRRQKIATYMLHELRSWWPHNIICTATGNTHSTPWLKTNGFVENESGWFLRPPQPPIDFQI